MSANRLKEYFNFSKKERYGMIALLVMLIFLWYAPLLFVPDETFDIKGFTRFEQDIAQLEQEHVQSGKDDDSGEIYYAASDISYRKPVKTEAFYFDPNTLKPAGWQRLGISGRTIQTIQNFIAKGGKFYKPEDIGKIWGLRKEEVERLLPYVKIPARPSPVYTNYKNGDADKYYEKQKYAIANVDINLGDTTAFISLPGIGGKLATRIVAFREKLGGFYAIEQVAETFGLPDSTYKKIKDKLVMANPTVKKININNATVDELKTHPYIRYNIANAIVQYRLQHGSYKDINDIKKIMLVTDEIYNKAAPYLAVK